MKNKTSFQSNDISPMGVIKDKDQDWEAGFFGTCSRRSILSYNIEYQANKGDLG